jgi:hypothetical protein
MEPLNQPIHRRELLRRAALTGALAAGLAPYRLASAAAGPGSALATQERPATKGIAVAPDRAFDTLFETYGDSGKGWTGSDGTYSVPLPDGRVIWLFSDTFLGTVEPNHHRPPGTPMIHNSAIIQDGTALTTLYTGSHEHPSAWINPIGYRSPDTWYWIDDGTVEGDKLRVFLPRFIRTGPGGWDFAQVAMDIGTLSLPGVQLQAITPTAAGLVKMPSGTQVTYGVAILEDDPYTYLYGVEDVPFDKYMHLARARAGDVLGPWEFFTGTGWSSDPQSSARMLSSIADQYSVTKTPYGYILITQDDGIGKNILIYRAEHPTGPWQSGGVLYPTPQSGGNIYTYAAMAHPEFSRPGELLISYDVNSFVFADVFTNVNNYRPRFIRASSS